MTIDTSFIHKWSGGGTYSDSTKWTTDLWRGHNGTDLFRDKNPSNLEIDFGQTPSQRYDWHRQKLNPGLTGGLLGTRPTTNTFSSKSILQYARLRGSVPIPKQKKRLKKNGSIQLQRLAWPLDGAAGHAPWDWSSTLQSGPLASWCVFVEADEISG